MASQIQFLGAGLGAASYVAPVYKNADVYVRSVTGKLVHRNPDGIIPSGSRVTVIGTAGDGKYVHLATEKYILASTLIQDANQIPGDGVTMLQSALKDLAALGYPSADPGSTSGVVDSATLRAVGAALGLVGGDLKGGQNVALGIQTAINLALVNSSAAQAATNAVRQAAKPLAVAVQVYVVRKRGEGLPALPDDSGGGSALTAWSPKKMVMIGAGGLAVIGVMYLLLKKKSVVVAP